MNKHIHTYLYIYMYVYIRTYKNIYVCTWTFYTFICSVSSSKRHAHSQVSELGSPPMFGTWPLRALTLVAAVQLARETQLEMWLLHYFYFVASIYIYALSLSLSLYLYISLRYIYIRTYMRVYVYIYICTNLYTYIHQQTHTFHD